MGGESLIGTYIGNYRLSYVVGEGGMGCVYAGVQPKIAGQVAIKILSSQDPGLVARFFAEAKAVNLIKHPSIVKVHDLAHLPDGRPYIIMELIEGETMGALVKRESLPLGGVADAMVHVLGALAAAHAIGIVHRDLKPDNIMVTLDGAAKVLDFGIAKLSPWLGGGTPRTQTGARIGTPAYMAPEQIRGTGVDARTDVYAAGVVLFEAVTGIRPFRGDNEFDLMKGHLEDEPPPLGVLRREATPELQGIVSQALAKKPEDRFQTATAMANALAHVATLLPAAERRPLAPQIGKRFPVPSHRRSSPAIDALAATTAERSGVNTAYDKPRPAPRSPRRRWRELAVIGGVAVAIAIAATALVVALDHESSRTAAAIPVPVPAAAAAATRADPAPAVAAAAEPTVETLPTGAQRITRRVAVDPQTFDNVAFLPEAQELARKLLSDAELWGISADSVAADGRVMVSPHASNTYQFVSPSRIKPPPGTPRGAARLCIVIVAVTAKGISAQAMPTTACNIRPRPWPTCHFADIWAKARARGASPDAIALVGWLEGRWVFQQNAVGHRPVNTQFKDDCGQ